jgi:tRNA-splicing ligase RtcB (3'-phosphate/5'-hydroxy nucleic acid ligase)
LDDRLRLTIPIKEIDSRAVDQITTALELPFLKALAIMPDVHSGYDLPIGGVALLDDHYMAGCDRVRYRVWNVSHQHMQDDWRTA